MVHDLNERMKALRDSQLSVDLMEVTGMLNGLFGEERKHLAKERERKLQQRELALLKENIFIAVVVAISAVFIAIVLKRLHISSVLYLTIYKITNIIKLIFYIFQNNSMVYGTGSDILIV